MYERLAPLTDDTARLKIPSIGSIRIQTHGHLTPKPPAQPRVYIGKWPRFLATLAQTLQRSCQ